MMPERRHLVGVVALLSLLGAVALTIWPLEGPWGESLRAGLWRGGTLAAIVWVAYPDLRRLPAWLAIALLATLVVVAVRPKTLVYAIPVILALALLRPRFGRRR